MGLFLELGLGLRFDLRLDLELVKSKIKLFRHVVFLDFPNVIDLNGLNSDREAEVVTLKKKKM